jgi:hypothetical protein
MKLFARAVALVVLPVPPALFSSEDLREKKFRQCLALLWQEYEDG